MALPKENRLRRRQDFKEVYQSGRRRTGAYFTVRSLKDKFRSPQSRRGATKADPTQAPNLILPTLIGISISQKVSKKAVVRNRIKRQIRAAIRQLLPRISPGLLVVIVVRPTASECVYVEILRELEQLLVEAEVINGHSRGSFL
ncbi:ribonuclease P protein component [Crinalium epipsammum PCC 9333]|uniref:Ribonuclease P protein component n=1 Tax=Crinalium epipsammum PCC 9333 TaxID=1173022 RepID=K9W2F6_9CYAN|nr:ribonuclease P protein component [Crinalium epipsammum]AFZ13585.1 ribonuclease P protein component [Crinalium epipsammum PCC 9333]